MAWFGFWIFLAVFVAVDAWLYSKGHEGFLFTHKTPAEKAIREKCAKQPMDDHDHPAKRTTLGD